MLVPASANSSLVCAGIPRIDIHFLCHSAVIICSIATELICLATWSVTHHRKREISLLVVTHICDTCGPLCSIHLALLSFTEAFVKNHRKHFALILCQGRHPLIEDNLGVSFFGVLLAFGLFLCMMLRRHHMPLFLLRLLRSFCSLCGASEVFLLRL